jgi:hypothetical protein
MLKHSKPICNGFRRGRLSGGWMTFLEQTKAKRFKGTSHTAGLKLRETKTRRKTNYLEDGKTAGKPL